MKLRDYLLEKLAEMVIGDHPAFPYRSSYFITRFFNRCALPYVHDGSTRKFWTADRLKELNNAPNQSPDLPSDAILRVVDELFDADDFDKAEKSKDSALIELNKVLDKQDLEAYFDASGRCYVRNTGSGVNSSAALQQPRPLTSEEIAQPSMVAGFLDSASEDDFTERLLVPLFQRLGFHRVSALGHKEKTLEYGKDLWMKYQLPTGHWIYFCAQIKREKLDVRGASADTNTATVLSQVRMAIDHPVFDPDTGRKVLVDHVFVITAGEITRAARNWLVEKLDQSQRRQIIFMDRDEFLDHSARILLDLNLDQSSELDGSESIPF
jgi:hypothetical protein